MTQTPYTHSPGSLDSGRHATVDPRVLCADFMHVIPLQGVFIDAGGGAGRDAVFFHELGQGRLTVFNIDPDPARFQDGQALYPGRIKRADSAADLAAIDPARHVVHVTDTVQSLAHFNEVAAGRRGDFVLCNAVMMFVPAAEQQAAITGLFNLLNEDRYAAVCYRTENLKDGMTKIDHDEFESRCRAAGFTPARLRDVPDPLGRDHVWHQWILHKP